MVTENKKTASKPTPPKDNKIRGQRYCEVWRFLFKWPHTKQFSWEIRWAQAQQWLDHERLQQRGVDPSSIDQMANKTKGAIVPSKRLRSPKYKSLKIKNFSAHPSNKKRTSAGQRSFRTFHLLYINRPTPNVWVKHSKRLQEQRIRTMNEHVNGASIQWNIGRKAGSFNESASY